MSVPRSSPPANRAIRIPSSIRATWDARAKRQLETAKKVLADEQAKAARPRRISRVGPDAPAPSPAAHVPAMVQQPETQLPLLFDSWRLADPRGRRA